MPTMFDGTPVLPLRSLAAQVLQHGLRSLWRTPHSGDSTEGAIARWRKAGQVQTDAVSVDEVWPWGKRIERTGETEGVGN